jgi:vancomycin resistance protein YoaR
MRENVARREAGLRRGGAFLVLACGLASLGAAEPVRDEVPPSSLPSHAEPAPRDSEITFPVLLGSFTTTLIGSLPARTENVRLAATAVDGAVLGPGDELSFNRVVGPRTAARGYRVAPVILHETRQQQAGGGVCQASSTLLVASLLSGLSVVERHAHSSPVDYVPLGHDATIAWGVKDLKIRNDLPARVRLRAEIVGSTLTVRCEGEASAGRSYELETEEREVQGDAGTTPGREIEVYRVHREAGETLEREFLHRDYYPPSRPRGVR